MIRTLIFAMTCAVPAAADTFCARLQDMAGKVLDLPDGSQGACSMSLNLSGEQANTCRWPFDYRAPEATLAFTTLLETAAVCLGTEAQADQGVNHPDSYDLRTFDTDQIQVAISIKDKGALQQTYVFLRRAHAP